MWKVVKWASAPTAYVVLMDYEKAYNRVSHTWLKRCMELSRFPSNLINFLSRLHEGTTARVLAHNSLSAEFLLHSGV